MKIYKAYQSFQNGITIYSTDVLKETATNYEIDRPLPWGCTRRVRKSEAFLTPEMARQAFIDERLEQIGRLQGEIELARRAEVAEYVPF